MKTNQSDFRRPMETWPACSDFARTIHLPHNGLDLFYYDAGKKELPAALMIHGLGDEADTWRHLITPLSTRWRVIAPDLPGFGRSSKPRRAYTRTFFEEVLRELLDELSIRRVFLIGHSLGAALAHQIALHKPELASGLVLLDGSIILQPQALNFGLLLFMVPGCGEWLYNHLRTDPHTAYKTLDPYYADLSGMPKQDCDFLFTRVNQRVWSDDQRRAYLSTLRNLAVRASGQPRNINDALAGLNVPTLVLWGENDKVYSAENARLIDKLQPDARVLFIPNAGHNLHQENPDRVIAEIFSDGRFI